MLMIGAQLGSDRSVKEMSTQEIIDRLTEVMPPVRESISG